MPFNLSLPTPKTIAAFLLSLVLYASCAQITVGQEDDPKTPTYPVEVLSIQTVLVDSNNNPIQDVKAFVFAMRCLEDRGSHYGWPSPNIGPVRDSQSQSDGKIKFHYPAKFMGQFLLIVHTVRT